MPMYPTFQPQTSSPVEKIFSGLKAWFSDSTKLHRINKWKNHGGEQADLFVADLIFSENAGHEDTVWIYGIDNYKIEQVTIFHPAYIDACIFQGSTLRVNLYNFILPSLEAQDVMRQQNIEIDFENPRLQCAK